MNIYILEQGAYLHKKGDSIYVEKDKEVINKIPMKDIKNVTLFGAVQVSIQCMIAMLEKGIDISIMTLNGNFRGKVVSALGKNIDLRIKQVTKSNDDIYCLHIAKELVKGKIRNGRTLLQYYYKNKNINELKDIIIDLKTKMNSIENAKDLASLLGYEGNLSRFYFDGFRKCLNEDIPFEGRKYFPSTDMTNALLSFGYSFLGREIQSMLEANSLDPYVGFYHQIKYGRASFSLDLVEELRHIIIDRLVLRILNKGILKQDDFEKQTDGSVYLNKDKVKIFISQYEKFVTDTMYDYCDKSLNTRDIIKAQVERIKRSISQDINYDATLLKIK